ncbi:DUF4350 domain-containing protein [Propionibacteriaceae bacterium Y1685]
MSPTAQTQMPGAATAPVPADQPERAPRGRRRGWWWWIPATAVLLVVTLAFMVGLGSGRIGDTQSGFTTDADGFSAIRALLEDEGVTIETTTRLAPTLDRIDPDTTVVIPRRAARNPDQLAQVLAAGPGRVVLVNARRSYLEVQSVPAELDQVPGAVYQAGCPDPAAGRAGSIAVNQGGTAVVAETATMVCYPAGEGHLYAVVPMGGHEVHLLNVPFDNQTLAREGNASLAMQVLGQHNKIIWYDARFESTGTTAGDDGPTLLGPTWLHAVGLALIALVTCAIWRGRRLGPIITEQLPVVIPAAETVEGHGRLYARIGAREHAAQQLRAAARRRMARLLGNHDDPEVLAQALADRTGHSYAQLRQWLDGPPPRNDDELVSLKRQLDALEQEARQP